MIRQSRRCENHIAPCHFLPYGTGPRAILRFLSHDLLFFQKLICSLVILFEFGGQCVFCIYSNYFQLYHFQSFSEAFLCAYVCWHSTYTPPKRSCSLPLSFSLSFWPQEPKSIRP